MADIAPGKEAANRTFRSIFGARKKRHDEALCLELERSGSSASITINSGVAMNDDDDEAMWNDEPLRAGAAAVQDECEVPGLEFAQRKSMEEWAEEDDEEENWKEALQDRVNQLALAFQRNDDAAAARSRRQSEQPHVQESERADCSQSLPVPMRCAALGRDSDRPRQSSRYKMQRTSSSHACITGDIAVAADCQNRLWNVQRKVAGESAVTMLHHHRYMRSTSTELVACNSQTVEHHRKRSDSLGGSDSRTKSPCHSMSRKNSFDNRRSSLSQSSSSSHRGTDAAPPADATPSFSSRAAVSNLSDTEAIRRFVLEDAKTMSMERLVSDAQRLQFLEDFYRNQQDQRLTPAVTTSTAAPPSSLASSSSAMSIS